MRSLSLLAMMGFMLWALPAAAITYPLSQADAQRAAEELFDKADINHDGIIDASEGRANKEMPMADHVYYKPETVQLCIKAGSGMLGGVDPMEKLKAMPDKQTLITKAKFLEAHATIFKSIDTDHNGIVTAQEVDVADKRMAEMCNKLPDLAKMMQKLHPAGQKHQ